MHAKAVSVLLLACTLAAGAQERCPSQGAERQELQQLRLQKFALEGGQQRARLADRLLPCLGSPDPELRDAIAFTAYSTWMRGKQLDVASLRSLRDRLYRMLGGADPQGFRRPFAALTLSEIARSDRIEPWMSGAERDAMVQQAVTYLQAVRDYRGFNAKEGWRHGVAHGSDWLLQLALNPALQRAHLDAMLAALATQVMPAGHAYVFGEPERLARPLLYIAARGLITEDEWKAWFASLLKTLGDGRGFQNDPAWLARRHDLHAFLTNLYFQADQSNDRQIHALKSGVSMALARLP